MSDRLVYLYGFVPGETTLPHAGLAGVAGGEVALEPLNGIAAAVSRVPRETYDPDSLEARLKDVPWVADQGLRHEQVVAWFVDHATIAPVRLFTLYSSADALAEEIAPRSHHIAERLEYFRSRREWDLKVAYDRDRLVPHLGEVSSDIRALDTEIEQASPGKRYLLERTRNERAHSAAAGTARDEAQRVLEQLRERAEDVRILDLPENAEGFSTVLGAALLIERDVEKTIREEAARLAAELDPLGIKVAFSGPWAPYRFSRPDAADAGPAWPLEGVKEES